MVQARVGGGRWFGAEAMMMKGVEVQYDRPSFFVGPLLPNGGLFLQSVKRSDGDYCTILLFMTDVFFLTCLWGHQTALRSPIRGQKFLIHCSMCHSPLLPVDYVNKLMYQPKIIFITLAL